MPHLPSRLEGTPLVIITPDPFWGAFALLICALVAFAPAMALALHGARLAVARLGAWLRSRPGSV